LDGPNRLLDIEPRTLKSGLLLLEIVELLLNFDLQLKLLAKLRHLRVNVWILQVSERLVDGVSPWVLT